MVDHLRKKGNYVPDNLRQKGTKLPAAKLPAAHQAKQGFLLPYNAPNPLSSGYCPKLDVTPELGEADASYYHTLVGILLIRGHVTVLKGRLH